MLRQRVPTKDSHCEGENLKPILGYWQENEA